MGQLKKLYTMSNGCFHETYSIVKKIPTLNLKIHRVCIYWVWYYNVICLTLVSAVVPYTNDTIAAWNSDQKNNSLHNAWNVCVLQRLTLDALSRLCWGSTHLTSWTLCWLLQLFLLLSFGNLHLFLHHRGRLCQLHLNSRKTIEDWGSVSYSHTSLNLPCRCFIKMFQILKWTHLMDAFLFYLQSLSFVEVLLGDDKQEICCYSQ